jgi:very-short-patch-repair endonuclease
MQARLNRSAMAVLAQRALQMRHAPQEPERLLWSALRSRQLGILFRRQVPVAGRFVADFLAPSLRLIVEVDGAAWHSQRHAADARRDRVLERAGYRVLRIEAELVMRDLTAAVALIRAAFESG